MPDYPPYKVTVTYDPNGGWGMHWKYKITDSAGLHVHSDTCLSSRHSAERKARRWLTRRADLRAYSFTIPGDSA